MNDDLIIKVIDKKNDRVEYGEIILKIEILPFDEIK
jgi:hypothetical protein